VPQRIGHLLEYPTLNGGERSLLAFLARLDRTRFESVVLAPGEGRLADAVRTAGIELRPFVGRGPRDDAASRVAGAVRELGLDLLHGNSLSMSLVTGPAGKLAGVSSVGHVRDIVRLNRTRASDLAANGVVVAVSEAVAAHLRAQGVPEDRIDVLPNGIDLEVFRPDGPASAIRAELGLADDARLVACIGQLGLRKATDVVLNAFARVAERHASAALLVIGERNSSKEESVRFESDLHAFVAAHSLGERVRFLGYRDDVPSLLRSIDVLAHGAHQEPLGRVLLEASASAVPIVATDVGGTREIVVAEETGLLVPAGDPEALGAAIERILDDEVTARRLGCAARRRATARFGSAQHAERMHHLLDSLP